MKRVWFVDSFVWWRGNHSMSFLDSVWMAIKMDIFNPIYSVYCWFWLKSVGRCYVKKMRKMELAYRRGNQDETK